jgi:hypothetical protein
MWTLAALLGCRHAPVAILVDWSATPHLPAPSAPFYAATPAHPEDKGVASVVGLRNWDVALSGAATGVALSILDGSGSLSPPELHEALFRAGWPYPVQSAQVWPGALNQPPPKGVGDWLSQTPPNASIGLVRARAPTEDLWVGLSSTVRYDLGEMPRQLPVGATLKIPAVPKAEVWVADPYGRLDHGRLDLPFTRTADASGEWLVEVRDAQGPIALFPVYVGMIPPDLGLLEPSPLPTDWQSADQLVVDRIADLRGAYGTAMYGDDLLLQAAAKSVADDPALDVRTLAPQLGIPAADLWRWDCQSTSVETCLDGILWDVRARPALLAAHALYGRDVQLNSAGIRIVLVVARDVP